MEDRHWERTLQVVLPASGDQKSVREIQYREIRQPNPNQPGIGDKK